MIQKLRVSQVPETGAVIRHAICCAGDVGEARTIAVEALVKGLKAKEIGWCSGGSAATFTLPGNSGSVV
jgi:hypothetical protein